MLPIAADSQIDAALRLYFIEQSFRFDCRFNHILSGINSMFRILIGLFFVSALTPANKTDHQRFPVQESCKPQLAQRYHMRNRTSHFYDRSAPSLQQNRSDSRQDC
jgi:hypothetical protein